MNSKTIIDPSRAIDAAIRDELDRVREDGHRWCRLPAVVQHDKVLNEPGTVPPGITRAVCQLIRGQGYTVTTGTPDEVAFQARMPVGAVGGSTTGWISRLGVQEGVRPFTVMIDRESSPVTKFGTLCHEAGHVLLRHLPRSEWENDRIIAAGGGRGENDDHETPCELGRAALLNLMGLSTDSSRHYLAHRVITGKGVADARRLARMLWPHIEPSLN